MATKSIFKDIIIRDRASGNKLLKALENAQKKKAKTVTLTRTVERIPADKIKDFFGVK